MSRVLYASVDGEVSDLIEGGVRKMLLDLFQSPLNEHGVCFTCQKHSQLFQNLQLKLQTLSYYREVAFIVSGIKFLTSHVLEYVP